MEKVDLVKKYELVIILDARLSDEEKESICKNVMDTVSKGGGRVINSQVWLKKHKFTFQIKKCVEGTYYLISFEGEGAALDKIRPILNINEKVLRFAIFKEE